MKTSFKTFPFDYEDFLPKLIFPPQKLYGWMSYGIVSTPIYVAVAIARRPNTQFLGCIKDTTKDSQIDSILSFKVGLQVVASGSIEEINSSCLYFDQDKGDLFICLRIGK